ncbi:MAG: RNA polymerase sigma factor [Planctomycetota bacterium]|nr:RNA polymerase sigma factor [Planctomycetota bacterium]
MHRSSDTIYEEWLVLKCQDGDRGALEELVVRWQPRLTRHAMRLTGRPEAAHDVMQEAWLAIVRGIGRLKDPSGFRAWSYRIVGNKCADWIRQRVRHRGLEHGLAMMAPNHEPTHDEERDETSILHEALDQLPLDHRVVLSMHYLDEMCVAEISRSLGVPAGTIKSRLHHARNRLKQALERMKQ